MNYEAIETEIVSRLNEDVSLTAIADVEVLPDSVDNYKTPVQKGLVTVVFLGEKYDSNQSVGQVSQHSTATFNISIQARLLRGVKGVYAISELVKQALVGFAPSDCGKLSLGDHDFAGYQNDIWEHSITLKCRSLIVQDYPDFLPGTMITDDEVYYTKQNTDENIHV